MPTLRMPSLYGQCPLHAPAWRFREQVGRVVSQKVPCIRPVSFILIETWRCGAVLLMGFRGRSIGVLIHLKER